MRIMVMTEALVEFVSVFNRMSTLTADLQRGEGEQGKSLDLGLAFHLGVPQDEGGDNDKRHVGDDGGYSGRVCDDEERLCRSTVAITAEDQRRRPFGSGLARACSFASERLT